MDKILLVEQIDDGKRLIERLMQDGISVTAACWLKEAESGEWYLYIATSLVGPGGGTRAAYHRVNTVIREMQKEGIWFDLFEYKVIAPDDPIAAAVRELQQRYPGRQASRYVDSQLGGLSIDGAYIYALATTVPR